MNFRTTWWLLGIGAALFLFIVVFEPPGDGREGKVEAGELFPRFDPARVSSVEVRGTNLAVRAERVGGEWRLANPAYPARQTGIESLLGALGGLRRHAEISANEYESHTNGLAAFGLAPPLATVTVEEGTNRLALKVGARTLGGGQLYAQAGGAPEVVVTGAEILERLPETNDAWRDPMLIRLGRAVFDRVTVTNGSRVFEVVRDGADANWRLTKPFGARADMGAVEYLLQQLRDAKVLEFVADENKGDLEAYGLQSPRMELTLSQGSNAVYRLQFGKDFAGDAAKVYARGIGRSNVVLVSSELAELLQEPHEKFRDRALLTFPMEKTHRVEVAAVENFAAQQEADGTWKLSGALEAPADAELVGQFLDRLSRIQVARFEKDVVTDFAPYGLAPPARSYSLLTRATNGNEIVFQPLLRADFSTNLGTRADLVYARRSDEDSLYAAPHGDVLLLPKAGFELRDRQIWAFEPLQVQTAEVARRGTIHSFARNAAGNWTEDLVANAAFDEWLYRLGRVRALGWVGRGEDKLRLFRFDDVNFRLELGLRAAGVVQRRELRFGRPSPSGDIYATTVLEGDAPVVFTFPLGLYKALVDLLPPLAPDAP